MKFNQEKFYPLFLILLLSIGASFIIYAGFGASDNNAQLPLLYRMMDSSYLKNDWFVNVNNFNRFNVLFYFNSFIFFLTFFVSNLPVLYFFIYLITCFSLGWSTYLISTYLFKDKKKGLLTSFFILFGSTVFMGGPEILAPQLSANLLSFAIAIWGFYFFLKEKYVFFSIFLGISSLIHILVGFLIFGVLFISSFFNNYSNKKNFNMHLKIAGVFFIFTLVLSPIVFSQINQDDGLSGKELVYIMGDFRLAHHIMAFSWPIESHLEFLLFLFLFILSFKQSNIHYKDNKLIKLILFFIFLSFLIGVIFLEIIPLDLIANLQPFRISPFMVFIMYLFIIEFIYNNLNSISNSKLLYLIYLFLGISFFYQRLMFLSIPLVFFVEYIKYRRKR
jgi:hypothetical protein